MVAIDTLRPEIFSPASAMRPLRMDDAFRYIVIGASRYGRRSKRSVNATPDILAINYVLSGRSTYIDWRGNHHDLRPGCLFHRYPGRVHSTLVDPASGYADFYLVIDALTARQMMEMGLIADTPVMVHADSSEAIDSFLEFRRKMLPCGDTLSARTRLHLINRFIGSLYEQVELSGSRTDLDRFVVRACALLKHSLENRVELSAIARELAMSYPTFRRKFQRVMGLSPGEYRIRCRLERACDLLRLGTVESVAVALGYADSSVFSSQFKSRYGMSPRQFQQQTLVEMETDGGATLCEGDEHEPCAI